MQTEADIESLYPETYRLINPMVMKACEENTSPITENLLEEMTKKIHANFEGEATIEINVAKPELRNGDVINPRAREAKREVKETRAPSYLDDLIRILILRNILTRPFPPRPGARPPFPGPGPRPPFPPRPPRPPMPGPGPRPPYMRNNEEVDYNNMY